MFFWDRSANCSLLHKYAQHLQSNDTFFVTFVYRKNKRKSICKGKKILNTLSKKASSTILVFPNYLTLLYSNETTRIGISFYWNIIEKFCYLYHSIFTSLNLIALNPLRFLVHSFELFSVKGKYFIKKRLWIDIPLIWK